MLDQIVASHPGRVAPVQWHTDVQFPLHSPEGRAKMRLYPPPLNGNYYTPWLWVDGHERGSDYGAWAGYVNAALTVPADVQVNVTGAYDQHSRIGQACAEFVNRSASAITANAYVVITEDSCNYTGPNGDPWHNHVCHDYLPDQYGTSVTIPAGGCDTLRQDFTIAGGWNEQKCNVVVYLQNPTTQPDSTKPVYNGGRIPLMLLSGIAARGSEPFGRPEVRTTPNPLRERVEFLFAHPARQPYRLEIRALDGSLVRTFAGHTGADPTSLIWDRADQWQQRVAGGVYVYRLSIGSGSTLGKLIVAP
jgi:hypothetical protein